MSLKFFRLLSMTAVVAIAIAVMACGGEPAPTPESATGAGGASAAPTSAVAEATVAPAVVSTPTAPSADLTFDNRPPQGGTLVRRWADPVSLDPHLIRDVTSSVIVNEVFGGLVTLSLNYQPVLDLAESYSVSDDGTVYTFVLRENARFHDGKPVTAHDVKWSIERAADPAILSPTAQDYLGDIVGVIDKLKGNADEVRGVRVIDYRSIEFVIDAPKSYFSAKNRRR